MTGTNKTKETKNGTRREKESKIGNEMKEKLKQQQKYKTEKMTRKRILAENRSEWSYRKVTKQLHVFFNDDNERISRVPFHMEHAHLR